MLTLEAPAATAPPDSGRKKGVRGGARALLVAFAMLTAVAVYQLVLHGDQTERLWPWTIQTGASGGFLAAAYAAGWVLSVASLWQTSWRRVRVSVATVGVFTALTLVATLVHAHRLHLAAADPVARGAAWFWVLVYLVVPVACCWVVAARARRSAADRIRCRPLPRWLTALLAGQGALLLVAGGVLFAGGLTIHHGDEPAAAWWPWPLTPLSAMVTGAWLIAFGVATALVIREGDLGRLAVPAATYAMFGGLQLVALVAAEDDLTRPGSAVAYAAVLVAITLTGGYGWRTARCPAQPADARPVDAGTTSVAPSSSGDGPSTTRLA